ncbi:hexosaminidase, partial [Lecanoromycetidae sp. Uapishka_2]
MSPWPAPLYYEQGSSTLWLSQDVYSVYYNKVQGLRDPARWYKELEQTSTSSRESASKYPSDLLQVAFERFKSKIFSENFIPYKFHPRKAHFEPSLNDAQALIREIVFENSVNIEDEQPATSREAFAIDVSEDGITVISFFAPEGGLRALDTLAQLFYAHSKSEKGVYTPFAPIKIKDKPAFQHRGLNLDISRNWIPPQDVKRTIEAMGFNKLNRLHLHATDSQSWPLEIPSLPALAKEGAYRPDQIWTVKDLKDIQTYGLYHGVEVYLEIDMPGHTASIAHSHPKLITAFNESWSEYALEPPAGQLKLNSTDVSSFLTTLMNDLLPRASPFSTHFHIGGDEINTKAYELDDTVNSSDRKILQPLLQKFIDHVLSLVQTHALTPIVWEDMLLEWDIKFPPSTIVQTWESSSSLAKVVAKGHRALFGPATDWYLDCGLGTFLDPDPSNPDTPVKRPFPDWCPPYKNWRHVLSYDPLADIPEEHRHLVIGGEVHLWGELTDSVNLDDMLWPRTAAAAGLLWRGKGEIGEQTTRALAEMRERLVLRGIRAGMVQMEWGLRNKGGCIL